MKTILFFDRCDLTRLYILLTKELQGKANVIHVAFSEKEANELKDAGISDYVDYQKELAILVNTLEPSESLIKEIDELIMEQSHGAFSLNASIQSDRGYSILTYEEALKLSCCHYTLWKNVFSRQHVDVVYHEPASLFMTHIAAVICKWQGGEYRYQTQLQADRAGFFYLNNDGENFRCFELEKKYEYFKIHPNEIDVTRCKNYLKAYRKDNTIAFSNIVKPLTSKWSLLRQAVKSIIIRAAYSKKYDKLKDNISYCALRNNRALRKLHNIREYKKRGINFSQPIEGERYFYYSIHLEPEATVLYLGGGVYTNQVKLIENIAAMLPPGYYLYVKDHPHEYAYRNADDYSRLMKIPNLRLIDQRVPGKQLVRDSIGVLSVVGTACFEGLMFGKQVYCFGKSYFTPTSRVTYIDNIKELRVEIYKNMQRDYTDNMELYAYIYAYLTSLHAGFVNYFGMDRIKNAGIDEYENARIIAEDMLK